jgi:hypothetical protein
MSDRSPLVLQREIGRAVNAPRLRLLLAIQYRSSRRRGSGCARRSWRRARNHAVVAVICRAFNELMEYLGLVPCENSTGDTVNRGGITKAGNGRVRRILVESAWSYRYPPRISREKQMKVAAAPRAVREITWKAQMKLCGRFRLITRKGKRPTVVARRSPVSWRPSSGRSIARSWDLMQRRASSPELWTARAMKGSTGHNPSPFTDGNGLTSEHHRTSIVQK